MDFTLILFLLLALIALQCHALHSNPATLIGTNATGLTINNIPFSTRVYWMRFANGPALNTSCPHSPFGTVIVNHTAPGLGSLVCVGQNNAKIVGNPTHHGQFPLCYSWCNINVFDVIQER